MEFWGSVERTTHTIVIMSPNSRQNSSPIDYRPPIMSLQNHVHTKTRHYNISRQVQISLAHYITQLGWLLVIILGYHTMCRIVSSYLWGLSRNPYAATRQESRYLMGNQSGKLQNIVWTRAIVFEYKDIKQPFELWHCHHYMSWCNNQRLKISWCGILESKFCTLKMAISWKHPECCRNGHHNQSADRLLIKNLKQ